MSENLSLDVRQWDDDVTSLDNYIMSKQLLSWILHLGFQNFFQNVRKPPKLLKSTQNQ